MHSFTYFIWLAFDSQCVYFCIYLFIWEIYKIIPEIYREMTGNNQTQHAGPDTIKIDKGRRRAVNCQQNDRKNICWFNIIK